MGWNGSPPGSASASASSLSSSSHSSSSSPPHSPSSSAPSLFWGAIRSPLHARFSPSDDDSPEFFSPLSDNLTWLMVQCMVILGVAAIVSRGLARLQVPSAVSQIITGIILGPTVMGWIPDFTATLFPEGELGALDTVAKLGLVFFMFLIGLELDIETFRKQLRSCLIVSISGVLVPLGIGAGVAQYLIRNDYIEDGVSHVYFSLFLSVAMAITAFPVLARIISEHGLLETSLGVLVLGSAAVDDLMGWIILAMNVALVRAGTGINGLYVCLIMIGFIAFQTLVMGRVLAFLCRLFHDPRKDLGDTAFLIIILHVLLSAWFTESLGVEGIFGAFICGTVVPRTDNLHKIVAHKFEDFVVTLFLPLYFALSGLKTQLALITTGVDWGSCLMITVLAFVGKVVPGYFAARVCGRNRRESLVVGFLRNAKGLVEIVVLNIGLNLGVLSKQVFGMFVVMAVVTTVCALPLVYLIHPPAAIIADDRRRRCAAGETNGDAALEEGDADAMLLSDSGTPKYAPMAGKTNSGGAGGGGGDGSDSNGGGIVYPGRFYGTLGGGTEGQGTGTGGGAGGSGGSSRRASSTSVPIPDAPVGGSSSVPVFNVVHAKSPGREESMPLLHHTRLS